MGQLTFDDVVAPLRSDRSWCRRMRRVEALHRLGRVSRPVATGLCQLGSMMSFAPFAARPAHP